MAQHWALLRPSEDGNPFRRLNPSQMVGLLANPKDWGVERFYELEELDDDQNYWPDGAAVLFKIQVVVPVPAEGMRLPEEDQ